MKNIFIRGGLGDLIVLMPRIKKYLKNENYKIHYFGELSVGTLLDYFTCIKNMELADKIIHYPGRCPVLEPKFTTSRFKSAPNPDAKFQMPYHYNPDSRSFKINDADNVMPELNPVDYCSVKYTANADFPYDNYVVVAPFSVSNPRWKRDPVYSWFQHFCHYILSKTKLKIVLLGNIPNSESYKLYLPNKLCNDAKWYFINTCGLTTIEEAIAIIKNAKFGIYFDSGLKNFAFLYDNPTIFLRDHTWLHSNPLEAWFPKQLQRINNNFLFDAVDGKYSDFCCLIDKCIGLSR